MTENDTENCGSKYNPCKTIEHAVNLCKNDFNLLLHSDSSYYVTKTIDLRFNINIQKYEDGAGNPRIHCSADNMFKMFNKVHFGLKSVDIIGTINKMNIIALRAIGVGNIVISNVKVTAKMKMQISLISLKLFQTAEGITISSSNVPGVLIDISSASFVCERHMNSVTIRYSLADSGIKLKGGHYNFGNIVVSDSSFQTSILLIKHSKSTINHVEITNTMAENGVIINEPSTPINTWKYAPRNIVTSNDLKEIAIIKTPIQPNGTFVALFAAHKSRINTILATNNKYPITDLINFETIQFTKSTCDTCIKSEAPSMNIKAIQFTESSCDTCIKSEAPSMKY